MKDELAQLLTKSLAALQADGIVPADVTASINIERTRDKAHGDFASNLALMLAKPAKKNPRQLAELIIQHLPKHDALVKTEIAGPGFINFFIANDVMSQIIPTILNATDQFGHCKHGKGQRIHLEYVSANPTGPLHVGHGRGAAYGSCVANLLKAIGYDVHQEYYVNDAGRQMRILGLSTWVRYCQQHKVNIDLPAKAYQGDYIIDIANELTKKQGDAFVVSADTFTKSLLNPAPEDPEQMIDALVEAAIQCLGADQFDCIRQFSLDAILDDIKEDLREFGVFHDDYFPESQLMKDGDLQAGIDLLKEHGYVYEKEGALWFRATDLGDEKDRVLVRANGQSTYFASDVAYHLHKYNQGYERMIDVFGADHHGYIARIRSFLKGLGKDPDKLTILLVQFAILYRGKTKVSMSTRSGEFVTLRELRHEVGNDATRYFYIMRKPEQHLDFDMELAKSKTNENPVYYIQYAHARICSVWRQLKESNGVWNKDNGLNHLSKLDNNHEKALITQLSRYQEMLINAAEQHEPHTLAYFLHELANLFHTYYNASKFLADDANTRDARLCLIHAVQITIANGLRLLGISAPESM